MLLSTNLFVLLDFHWFCCPFHTLLLALPFSVSVAGPMIFNALSDSDQQCGIMELSFPVLTYFRSQERKYHRWNFRSLELSFSRTFVPWNFRSQELSLLRAKVTWNFRSRVLSFPGTFAPSSQSNVKLSLSTRNAVLTELYFAVHRLRWYHRAFLR